MYQKILRLFLAGLLTAGLLNLPPALAALPAELTGVSSARHLYLNGCFADSQNHWAAEALFGAGVNGFLHADASNRVRPDEALTRADALLAIARLAGWLPGDPTAAAPATAKAEVPLAAWQREARNLAQQKGILTAGQTAADEEPVTRAEMAVWLAKALNLPPAAGQAPSRVLNHYADWSLLSADQVPWMEAALENGFLQGSLEADGRRYLHPGGPLSRAAGAVMLANSLPPAHKLQNRPVVTAHITDIREITPAPGKPAVRRVHLSSPAGEAATLVLTTGATDSTANRDVAVWRNGPADGKSLQPGDQVELYFAPPATAEQGKNQTVPTRVYFIKVKTGPATKTATGVFVQYQPPTPPDQPLGLLTLRDAWGGDVCQYPVAPKVWLKINEITRPLADLPPGSLVTATLHGDEITHLTATLAPAEPGAIPPGSLVRQGRLRSIDAGRVTLVAADGREARYALSPAVEVIAGNQLATLDDLQPGDPVTLRLGDYLGTTVERIEIPRLNRTVAGVYKGVVEFINPVTRQATLRQATKLAGAAWTPLTGKISVRLPDTNLFVNGQAVSPETFTRYGRGKTILFSAATDFGAASGTRFNATRLTVLNGLGQPFNDRIAAIDPGGKVLTTGISGSSLVLDQTTIILRNGRLADARDLTAGDPVTLYADAGATGYRAALLVVDKERVPTVAPDDGLIQGWIRWFNADGEITAGPYSRLREHTWETFGTGQDTTTFNPAPDTLVFDQRQGTTATVPVEDFLTLGVNGDYDDCYFLAYLRQGRPVAITLQSPGPLGESRPPEQTTLARLERLDTATGTGRFTAVQDWSDHSRRWVSGNSDLTLDLAAALVLKNGRVTAKEQLKPGDQCQIIRRWDPDRAKNIASFIFILD